MDLVTLALAKKYADSVASGASGDVMEQISDQLLPEVNTDDNNKIVIVENGQWKLVSANRFKSNPIQVTSMSATPSKAEYGEKFYKVVLKWNTNLPPVYLKVAGEELQDMTLKQKTITYDLGITGYESWSMTVKDELGNSDNASASLIFYNRNWYGSAKIPETLDSDFIKKNLTRTELTNSRGGTITPTSQEGQYVWYAVPKRLGTCTFQAGALPGGFQLVDTILFENELGYKENYYVYRSDNVLLGTHTVVIK